MTTYKMFRPKQGHHHVLKKERVEKIKCNIFHYKTPLHFILSRCLYINTRRWLQTETCCKFFHHKTDIAYVVVDDLHIFPLKPGYILAEKKFRNDWLNIRIFLLTSASRHERVIHQQTWENTHMQFQKTRCFTMM